MLSNINNQFVNCTTNQTAFKGRIVNNKMLKNAISNATDGELERFCEIMSRAKATKDSKVFALREYSIGDTRGKVTDLLLDEVGKARAHVIADTVHVNKIGENIYKSALRKVSNILESFYPKKEGLKPRSVYLDEIDKLIG